MKNFYVMIITAIVMGWLAGCARNRRAKKAQDGWVFYPILAVRSVYVIFLAMAIGFMVWVYLGPKSDRVLMLLGLLFVAFGSITWPKAIWSSASGLRQRRWWGGWKIIRWEDVDSYKERQDQCIVIRTAHEKLVFSPYQAGRDLFLEQLKSYGCRNGLASDVHPRRHGRMKAHSPNVSAPAQK